MNRRETLRTLAAGGAAGAPGKSIIPTIERVLDGETRFVSEDFKGLPRPYFKTVFALLVRRMDFEQLTALQRSMDRIQRDSEARRAAS